MLMPRPLTLALLLAMTTTGVMLPSIAQNIDPRVSLGLTDAERIEFLAEMRQMLASVQGIITGIGTGDRQIIAAAARLSGNRMARATPESVRTRLPQAFKEIGGATHLLFEEIAVRAETDDMGDLATLAGKTLEQCLACHAQFRAL